MTTRTLPDVVAAVDGLSYHQFTHYPTQVAGGRIFVDFTSRTDFLTAAETLELEVKESPQQSGGLPMTRFFYAADGPPSTANLLLQVHSRSTDPDWEDPA